MKNVIGQVKFIYSKEMDHFKEGKDHPFVVMGQEGEVVKGFFLSSVECKEYQGGQKGFFVKNRIAYPAFNYGEVEMAVSEFKGEVIGVMGKADRNQVKVEFSRFQKAFG